MKKFKIFSVLFILCVIIAFSISCGRLSSQDINDEDINLSLTETEEEGEIKTLSMPTIFGNGMVFQRNKDINVYGYSTVEGAAIKVTFMGQTKEVEVKDGRFDAVFPSSDIQTGLSLTVEQLGENNEILEFSEISIGEVWVVSGQSNADFEVFKMADFREYLLLGNNYPNLHLYTTPNTYVQNVDLIGQGKWMKLDKAALNSRARVSAHMYVTAVRLAAEFGSEVPIAVVHVARPSSSIFTWLDYDTLYSIDIYEAMRSTAYKNFYNKNGFYPQSATDSTYYDATCTEKPYARLGTVCYMTFLAHLEGYATRGVVWYQGESDIGRGGSEYEMLFGKLKSVFDRVFGGGESVPIFVVQLSPYADVYASSSAPMKDTQYDVTLRYDDVYVISSIDGGSLLGADNIKYMLVHSTIKSPIGLRCANSILKNIYGIEKAEVMNAPRPVSVSVDSTSVRITFDSELLLYYGKKVMGFEILDGMVWKKVEGVIDGNTVVLDCSAISNPKEIRYGYGNYILEMQDGTTMEVLNYTSYTDYTVLHLANGENYNADADDEGLRLRFMSPGNVTNDSGEPLFVFKIEIGG